MNARGVATAGAVVAAIASSACCWLPLVLVATGVSAAGATVRFEAARIPFLVGAALLLITGFVLTYRRARVRCVAGGSCVARTRPVTRAQRGMLWLSTAMVLTFALFPGYVGRLATATEAGASEASRAERLVLHIDGMTCAGCESALELSLGKLPGVRAVTADHAAGTAVVEVRGGTPPERLALIAAVGRAGYSLTEVSSEPSDAPSFAGHWVTELETEEGSTPLVVDIGRLGTRWVGEFDLEAYGVENYPIEVSPAGNTITLLLTATGTVFEGTLSGDGRALSGTEMSNGEALPLTFRREGDAPRFSEAFLALKAAADDPSLVETLSAGGAELVERFNEDQAKTRLLVLLSPT